MPVYPGALRIADNTDRSATFSKDEVTGPPSGMVVAGQENN